MATVHKNRGQVMLMSVLLICGAILAVSALASSLVLQQLKKSTAAGESARAVFAADAGVERALWERYHNSAVQSGCASSTSPLSFSDMLTNDSEYTTLIKGCDYASSLGEYGRSVRAFHISFDGLCNLGGQLDDSLCATSTGP